MFVSRQGYKKWMICGQKNKTHVVIMLNCETNDRNIQHGGQREKKNYGWVSLKEKHIVGPIFGL